MLTATIGAGGATAFTLEIDNPTDATGATQSITATLSAPIDQPGADLSQLDVSYEVRDIDSATAGTATFTITDDTPPAPQNDAVVVVTEGGAAVGPLNPLLANDTLGADGGRVYDITYTDRSGAPQTVVIPAAGSTVDTQYGTLTVARDGTWSYTPIDSADHEQPTNNSQLPDNFTYRTIDGDGDISTASATQAITVLDTTPGFGTPEDATVDETDLPLGSAPDATALVQTGALNPVVRQDSIDITLTGLPAGLTSDGVAIEYVTAPDGHSVIAYVGAGRTDDDRVFTVELTNPTDATAGYSFELLGALDHGMSGPADLEFGVTVTDSDADTDTATFTVTVLDDSPPAALTTTLDEDGSVAIPTSADSTPDNTVIWQGGVALTGVPSGADIVYTTANGTVTVLENGSIVYEPADNFSGDEIFEFVINDGGVETRTDVTATVNPVSDAPTLTVDTANINTLEDTVVALGLNAPVLTDDGTGTGNNPVTERIGLVTLTGLPEGALLATSGLNFVIGTGPVTIEINDIPTLSNVGTATLVMTTAQYEALTVRPPEHTSDEFTVTASVSSFEVDGAGAQLAGVPGATQTVDVIVDVQAVTDDAALLFNGATTIPNVDAVTYTPDFTEATIELEEDAAFSLNSILDASFADLDGSEVRSITITNNGVGELQVGGTVLATGESITIDDLVGAGSQTGDITGWPAIELGGGPDFSGDLDGITITINAQDVDADGFLDGTGTQTGTPQNGVAEADTTNNTVTLNLQVNPVAGDVAALNATGAEDTDIAFLAGVFVTDRTGDAGSPGGNEVITEASFDVPAGWTLTPPAPGSIWSASLSGSTYTITFTGGSQSAREAVLDAFTITPPAHSSLDAVVSLSIETVDTATVDGAVVSDTQTVLRDITIEVTPEAEVIGPVPGTGDSDGNGVADLTMNPSHTYGPTETGTEDTAFELNQGTFDLAAGWSNEDGDEIGAGTDNTYARLTPEIVVGNPAEAIGTVFSWTENGTVVTATFTGAGIDIPVSALSTVSVLPAPDFAGEMRIRVTAYTEDFDDDNEGNGAPGSTAESGEEFLEGIVFNPVADDVALTLTARANGFEDTEIPLLIRPASSDDTETFNITINDIPDGARIFYDGVEIPVISGSVELIDFDTDVPLTILPAPDSNEDFALEIEAVSVDTVVIDGVTFTSTSTPPALLPLTVDVRGVADPATVTVTPQTYTEVALDGGATVPLADLFSAALQDTDAGDPGGPSETLTVRVSGLPDGFSVAGASLLTAPDVTGLDRIWSVDTDQLTTAQVITPDNASGLVVFEVSPVTTENDGASLTNAPTLVGFTVTPSPEATTTTSAVLVEDVVTSLGFAIVHEIGDTDETITGARIRVGDEMTADYTLYLGTGVGAIPLADAGLPTVTVGPDTFYQLTGAEAALLSALTAEHVDGDLGSVEILYEVTDQEFATDQEFGTGALSTPVVSPYQPVTFDLSATPVTDAPDVTITAISGTLGTTTTSDLVPGDDASPDRADLTEADTVTVTINVASPDADGSEHLTRILITGVPIGVTVEGAQIIGTDSWLLVYEGTDALPLDPTVDVDIDFIVTDQVGAGDALSDIDITVQVQDRGNEAAPGTTQDSDTVTWELNRDFPGAGNGEDPAQIIDWIYTNQGATEDVPFPLSDMITGTVNATSANDNTLTVQLTGLPEGTVIEGMTPTFIDGALVYSASVISNSADAQTALETLLDSITITLPENSNDNNNTSGTTTGFPIIATLTTSVVGGSFIESETIDPVIPVLPVVDPATIDIALGAAGSGGDLSEAQTEIPITINVTNDADGAAGSIVDGNLYVQIDLNNPTPQTGVLTSADGLTTYTLETVSGVTGLPDGQYYVIDNTSYGTPVDLLFTPDATGVGSISVDAFVVNEELGDPDAIVSSSSETQTIEVDNNGVVITSAPSTGSEAPDNTTNSLIELAGLSVTLNDDDGSEALVSILLGNLPDGFLVFTGDTAATATAADPSSNAGGSGGLNTWVLSGAGEDLPAYVGILPPQNWSGTLDDLRLLVSSGETTLDEATTDVATLEPVTVEPEANGIVLAPTNTFGDENEIVPFKLNAAISDLLNASVLPNAPDQHVETATLQITGLGAFASFYLGTAELIDGVSYDAGSDTYTIAGLTQEGIDALGFTQAADALTDQNTGQSGLQITVSGFTVDASTTPDVTTSDTSAIDTTEITVNLTAQLPTTADDALLWTGSAIDGLDGEDTVALRADEDLAGTELDASLSNIETLDLGAAGANELGPLTTDQVLGMTDDDNELTITGTAEDTVNLSSGWSFDSGAGTYTGTSGSETVTLTIDSAVTVNLAGPLMMMAPMSFGFAALDALPGEGGMDDKAKGERDGPSLDDVMMPERQDDLGTLLPPASSGQDAPAHTAVKQSAADALPPDTSWEDDSQNGVVYDS